MSNGPLQKAVLQLSKQDNEINEIIINYGLPNDRMSKGGFETLLRMIVGQQISVIAADAVWAKLKKIKANVAKNFLLSSDDKLREAGLSRQKISYGRDLAENINSGCLNLNELGKLPTKEAHLNLTKIKGIGDWTADIYQLFVLGDMDAFPQDDLAVQEGARRFFKLNQRPKGKELLNLAERWRPLRGAAALVMWQIYRIEIHEGSKFN
tara:strand:- start:282 stop:908 length:627 start_codon:yes stop_codon:yes gene_type:complete